MTTATRTVRAPRGTSLTCKGWPQEAALRMLMNNLDPDVAERPDDLIVYGGSGKAARNWPAFDAIVRCLTSLEHDETLLVQSGKPVGIFQTHPGAPRVLIANALIVPAWATWENFRDLEDRGLTMYGQMTAGSWIYIGSQGIVQGTYETLAAVARRHFGGSLSGRLVVTAGLGGMGGAQPLAATMNGAAALVVEVDPRRIERRLATKYLDEATDSLDDAIARVSRWTRDGTARSIRSEEHTSELQSPDPLFPSTTLFRSLVVTAGLGGMGGAQPLAATMNGAAALVVEVDPRRIERRLATKYLDEATDSLDDAIARVSRWTRDGTARSIAVRANAADVLPALVARGVTPDVLTDQTSAHDALNGYVPNGMSLDEAERLRDRNPSDYVKRSMHAMADQVRAMLTLQQRGAVTFDYGNNIRAQAAQAGVANAFDIRGFVPEYIRPLFCEGRGPFRWAALSGDPEDIRVSDDAALEMFGHNDSLARWIRLARERVAFQGLPARILWLGTGARARVGSRLNELVRERRIKAPIVIGRDHLDTGSVASPNRETEGMRDGSDAIADWPILNALLNASGGATWVSVHHGGGVGIGYSLHAGMVIVADGTPDADARLERVLTCDPGIGGIRHAGAGYQEAIGTAEREGR